MVGSIEAGGLYCLIVQARGLDSELKAENYHVICFLMTADV